MIYPARFKALFPVLRFLLMSSLLVLTLPVAVAQETRDEEALTLMALDSEIQAIKGQLLDINRDLILLEEPPAATGDPVLVIMVSLSGAMQWIPAEISLDLEGAELARHRYTDGEARALQSGGAHQVFAGTLKRGQHMLDIELSGESANRKPFTQHKRVDLSLSRGRKYLELKLGGDRKSRDPTLSVQQWQR